MHRCPPLPRFVGLFGALLLVRMAVAAEPPKAPPRDVYLGRSSSWALTSGGVVHTGRLAREIARQALLIAARDERQLATRDFWLGDPPPATSAVMLDVVGSAGNPSLIEVVMGPPGQQELLWQHEFAIGSAPFDYPAWTARMETLSRTRFVDALGQAGFKRLRLSGGQKKKPAEDVDPWLNSLTLTGQFQAIRTLHTQLATEGESSLRLAGLARGYAHLGVLSEYFWHPMHEVFKARAMLYAERLVARDNWSASALAHRGYVWALVGLQKAALDDLALARTAKAEPRGPKQAPLPEWVDLIEAFCRFDPPHIQTKDARYKPLAALLRLFAAEQAGQSARTTEVAIAEIASAPECYRICDGFMLHYGEESSDEQLELPPNGEGTFARTLGLRLQEMPGLPAKVAKLLTPLAAPAKSSAAKVPFEIAPPLRGEILAALQDTPAAADEFSWPLLGRLLEEVAFYQAWRQLRPDLGRNDDTAAARLVPGVPRHRYRGFLEMAYSDPTAHRKGFQQLVSSRDSEVFEPWHAPVMRHITSFKSFDPEGFVVQLAGRTNIVARELTFQGGDARAVLRLSPYSPWARAAFARHAWPEVAEQAVEWEKTSAEYPHVLAAIGSQWIATGKLADAERILSSAYEKEPSAGIAGAVANLFERQGKLKERVALLKEILTFPDVSDPAQIQVQIATYYMQVGDWEQAAKYADPAAEQGNGAGRLMAADINEVRHEWAAAEKQFRSLAEPLTAQPFYPEWLEWLAFCKRTGQGDELAAHRQTVLALQRFEPWQKTATTYTKHLDQSLVCYLLHKQPEKAFAICDEAFQAEHDPFYGLHGALVSDRAENVTRRNQWLEAIAAQQPTWAQAHPDRPQTALFALAKQLIDDLAKPEPGGLASDDVNKLAADVSESEQIDVYYFAGEYLLCRGKSKAGVEMLEECMVRLPIRAINRTLAGQALWERSVTPTKYATRLRDRSAVAKPLK